MAINFAKPATTDNYLTEFVPNIQANQNALAQWLDSTQTTITGTAPTYAKRYNRASSVLEEFNGTTWATLPLSVSGNAGTATTAGNATGDTFWTNTATTEGQIGAKVTGYNPVYLYNNSTGWGVYSTTGGSAFSYTRSSGIFLFNGNASGSSSSCTGNSVTATTATNQSGGTVSATTGAFSSSVSGAFFAVARESQASDPYGPISVTRGVASNFAYYGLTRSGQIGWCIGIDTSNRMIFGSGGNGGAMTNIATNISNGGEIVTNGNVTAYGTASDIRLKENIVKLDNCLDKVGQLNGYSFNYIGKPNKMIGVIAQELEAVAPELVYEFENIDTNITSKAVHYGQISALLIEAIKELREEVQALREIVCKK